MITKTKNQLAEEIESVFSNNFLPDTRFERKEVQEIVGKDWKEIPLEIIVKNNLHIFMFNPEAFHYYLPAFIKAVLLHFDEVDVLREVIVNALTPDNDRYLGIQDTVNLFSIQEKKVILEFLENYQAYFPMSVYALLDEPQKELQRAIAFWKSSIASSENN